MSSPISISSIPTILDLYNRGELSHTPADSTLYDPSSTINSRISIVRADITKLATTCIVNAANTSLLGGGGVDGAIHAAAGPGLYEECLPLHGCPTGSAKITSAHALPSKHVIHAVGPIYAKAKREGGQTRPKELLEGCYQASLDLAAGVGKSKDKKKREGQDEDSTSIAFSCLSTGVYGYPSSEAARVACQTVRNWLRRQEEKKETEGVGRVVFCCFLDKDVRAYEEWLPRVFPPPDANLSRKPTLGSQDAIAAGEAEENEDEVKATHSTGNTQTFASTSLTSSPNPKRQRTTPPSSQILNSGNDDDKDWEPVEKPQASLASSTIDSTTSASEVDLSRSTESIPLDESTVNVDTDTAAAAAATADLETKATVGMDDAHPPLPESRLDEEDEGVKVERPKELEEDEGVKVEKPRNDNLLEKDW